MSASALSAGLACLMAFARSTKSCSREEGGTPVARTEGDPPEGGPLVSGTVVKIIQTLRHINSQKLVRFVHDKNIFN